MKTNYFSIILSTVIIDKYFPLGAKKTFPVFYIFSLPIRVILITSKLRSPRNSERFPNSKRKGIERSLLRFSANLFASLINRISAFQVQRVTPDWNKTGDNEVIVPITIKKLGFLRSSHIVTSTGTIKLNAWTRNQSSNNISVTLHCSNYTLTTVPM